VLSYLASKPSLGVRSGAPVVKARPAAAFAASFAAAASLAACTGKGTSEQLGMNVINHDGTKVWPLSPKDGTTG
jgi:hypothetical protein